MVKVSASDSLRRLGVAARVARVRQHLADPAKAWGGPKYVKIVASHIRTT
jgi:hypothetical protein